MTAQQAQDVYYATQVSAASTLAESLLGQAPALGTSPASTVYTQPNTPTNAVYDYNALQIQDGQILSNFLHSAGIEQNVDVLA